VGTAWALAEAGHEVTIVTPDPIVGKDLQRSAADLPARKQLRGLGVRFVVESAVDEWLGNGGGAEVVDLMSAEVSRVEADDLVMATTNRANDALAALLEAQGVPLTRLGDACAPRMAALAFFEGRKWAIGL